MAKVGQLFRVIMGLGFGGRRKEALSLTIELDVINIVCWVSMGGSRKGGSF